jgi:hypothetical protein
MAIPDQRKRLFLSIPTQTAMKGLRDAAPIRNAAVQRSATFSSLILEDFEI